MRSNLDRAARRQILADIGIDVWRVRTQASTEPDAVRDAATESRSGGPAAPAVGPHGAAPASATARVDARDAPVARAAAGDLAPPGPGSADPVGASARSGTPNSSSPAASGAFSVLSLSAGGVILLLDRSPAGRETRLARDLLAAANGRWDLEPAVRRFDWPPALGVPGVSGDGAVDRALRAFVEKELADQGGLLLLLNEALAVRLDGLKYAGERVLVPDLAVLGRESLEKRRIWQQLGRFRRVPPSAS